MFHDIYFLIYNIDNNLRILTQVYLIFETIVTNCDIILLQTLDLNQVQDTCSYSNQCIIDSASFIDIRQLPHTEK